MKLSSLITHYTPPEALTLADIWNSWSVHAPLIATIKDYGISIVPDDWVPWFVWDLGLEEVVPYVRDMRQALAEGPLWQRTRGTPRGIEIGIGWVQSSGTVAGPDQRHAWWEFQVSFETPVADMEQLRQLDGIIRLSKAAEDELFRMASPGADWRPVRMDIHRYDDGLMDGYSGASFWSGGPLVSLGWHGAYVQDVDPYTTISMQLADAGALVWFEGSRLDEIRTDERAALPVLMSAAEVAISNESDVFVDDVWPIAWPESWADAAQPQFFVSSWGAA